MSTGIQHATNQSIKPFKSSEEYLYAMKEDLAEWLKDLYGIEIDVSNILEMLETGAVLCSHANNVTRVAEEFIQNYGVVRQVQLPSKGVTFVGSAQPATFLARDNISNFINWCRLQMNIKDVLMFETDDLVLRKNEKNFVLCLLEVARRASRFGMAAPVLIQLEQEIEEEMREELEVTPPPAKPQRCASNTKNLDEMVQHLISRCTCPFQFPMIKMSEGKYKVGDSSTLIFVRILRNHVMVRVGGGWDTLEHYLDKHDPCRCTSLSHKLAQRPATPVHEIKGRMTPRPDAAGGTQQPATLLLSRHTPLPLQPVLWTPSASTSSIPTGLRSASLSPDHRSRTPNLRSRTPDPVLRASRSPSRLPKSPVSPDPGPRDTIHNLDSELRTFRQLRTPSPSRLRQSASTPTLQHLEAEKCDLFNSSTRVGREPSRSSPAPRLTSSLPRPIQRSSTPQPQSQHQPQPQPQPQQQRSKTPLVFQRLPGQPSLQPQSQPMPDSRLTQLWTKSQFASKLRQSSNNTESASLSSIQRQGRACTPRCATPRRGYSPARYTPVCTRQTTITFQEPKNDSAVQKVPNFIRTFCPAKNTRDNSSWEAPVRSLTPVGGNPESVQNKTSTPEKILTNPSQSSSNGETDHGKLQCLSGQNTADKTSSINVNVIGSLDELDLTKDCGKWSEDRNTERSYLFIPPPPISPAEEASLYQSLEDEILANLQQLSVDSSDDSHSSVPEDSNHSHSNQNAPESQKQDSITDATSVSSPSKASYDAVIAELYKGKELPVKVCVNSWVNTLPRGSRGSKLASSNTVVDTGLNLRVTSSWSSLGSSVESKEPPECKTSPYTGNRVSVSRCNTSAKSTSVNLRNDSTEAENQKKLRPGSFRRRRTLKKPERVPSIYKLKLRPRVRPRHDHRPGKKPSRIPTPISYRVSQQMEDPGGAMGNKSNSHRQPRPLNSHIQSNKLSSVKSYGSSDGYGYPMRQREVPSQETAEDSEHESWV